MKAQPAHLKALFEKKDAEFKAMGFKTNPDDEFCELMKKAYKQAEKNDNHLLHAMAK